MIVRRIWTWGRNFISFYITNNGWEKIEVNDIEVEVMNKDVL